MRKYVGPLLLAIVAILAALSTIKYEENPLVPGRDTGFRLCDSLCASDGVLAFAAELGGDSARLTLRLSSDSSLRRATFAASVGRTLLPVRREFALRRFARRARDYRIRDKRSTLPLVAGRNPADQRVPRRHGEVGGRSCPDASDTPRSITSDRAAPNAAHLAPSRLATRHAGERGRHHAACAATATSANRVRRWPRRLAHQRWCGRLACQTLGRGIRRRPAPTLSVEDCISRMIEEIGASGRADAEQQVEILRGTVQGTMSNDELLHQLSPDRKGLVRCRTLDQGDSRYPRPSYTNVGRCDSKARRTNSILPLMLIRAVPSSDRPRIRGLEDARARAAHRLARRITAEPRRRGRVGKSFASGSGDSLSCPFAGTTASRWTMSTTSPSNSQRSSLQPKPLTRLKELRLARPHTSLAHSRIGRPT